MEPSIKENLFSLQSRENFDKGDGMEKIDPEYQTFYNALMEAKNEAKGKRSGFQKKISDKTGLSSGFISDILNNKKKASHQTQISILRAVGFNPESLLSTPRKEEARKEQVKTMRDQIKLFTDLIKTKDELIARDAELIARDATIIEMLKANIERLELKTTGEPPDLVRPNEQSKRA